MAVMALQDPLGGAGENGQLAHVNISDIPRGELYAGMRIRRFREESNYSIKALAESVQPPLPESTLRFFETVRGRLKRRDPEHVAYVKGIAKVLGVAELRIWYGDGAPPVSEQDGGPDEQRLTQDVASFLAKLSVNRSLSGEIRSEAKVLLDHMTDMPDED